MYGLSYPHWSRRCVLYTPSHHLYAVKLECTGYSPVESELDLDLGYTGHVLMDFDSKIIQTQDSGGCHLGTLGQLSEFNMAPKMVDNCKGHTVQDLNYNKVHLFLV